jgi:hypothetical protein
MIEAALASCQGRISGAEHSAIADNSSLPFLSKCKRRHQVTNGPVLAVALTVNGHKNRRGHERDIAEDMKD